MTEGAFRILSIDGGGVRGYLAASILANIEAYLDNKTGEEMPLGLRFDFIAGTSSGGLIALALGLGRRASEVRDLFLTLVPKVFGSQNRRSVWLRAARPRYGSELFRDELETFFGAATLADLERDVCITSVSLIDAKPKLHKTDYFTRNASRLKERLIDVALATTAAPTYFAAHSSQFSANLIDGGVAANNPAIVALVDALQFERGSKRGTPRPNPGIEPNGGAVMISIGTGQPGPLPYDYDRLVNGGWGNWLLPIHELILLSQAQLVHDQAKFLLGSRYMRVDPILKIRVKLDDAAHFRELRNKADIDHETEKFLEAHFT